MTKYAHVYRTGHNSAGGVTSSTWNDRAYHETTFPIEVGSDGYIKRLGCCPVNGLSVQEAQWGPITSLDGLSTGPYGTLRGRAGYLWVIISDTPERPMPHGTILAEGRGPGSHMVCG